MVSSLCTAALLALSLSTSSLALAEDVPQAPLPVESDAAPAAPPAPAPTYAAPGAALEVTLRDGRTLHSAQLDDTTLLVRDATTGLQAVPFSQIVSITGTPGAAPGVAAPAPKGLAAPAPAERPVKEARLILSGEPEGLRVTTIEPGGRVVQLCAAPCEARLPEGRHVFAVQDEQGEHMRRVLDVRDGDELRAKYDARAPARLGGALILALGAALGGTMIARREDADGDVSKARVAGGISAVLAGVGVGVTLMFIPAVRKIELVPGRRL